jgi:hypothetical protein
VHWYFNKTAWMLSTVFQDWLRKVCTQPLDDLASDCLRWWVSPPSQAWVHGTPGSRQQTSAMASAASVTCNSFLQGVSLASGSVVFACAQTSLTHSRLWLHTARQVLTLIHINEADKFQLRLLSVS